MDAVAPDTGSATTGPTSFSEVSWRDAPSASDPSSEQPSADSASADAIDPPAPSASPEGSSQQGEPPKDRWPDILANARQKAVEEALAQHRQQYGWAEQIDQPTLQAAIQFYQQFQAGDPVELLQELATRVSAHPEHGAKLRSFAAKQLAAARGQSQPQTTDTGLPNVEITDAQGQVVGTLAQILDAERQRVLAAVREEMQPVVKTVEQVQKERARAADALAAEQFGTTTFGELSQYQGMDDPANRKAVGEAIKAMGLRSDDPRDIRLAADAAWRQVVLPKLSSKAQSQLLDNLQHKAAASTGINPGSAAPSTPRDITSFHELGREAWR